MSIAVNLLAPTPYAQFFCRSGNVYTASSAGMITSVLVVVDIQDLIADGCISVNGPMTANFRNLLDGGDATTNPWQRGTTFAAITNTVTYTMDRFFALGGASSSIAASQQAQTDVAGFSKSLRWGRTSTNTNTAVINLGQVLESNDSVRAQGQQVTLSFWAKAGATWLTSITGGLNVQIVQGTGADQSAANMVSNSWTAQSNVVNSTGNALSAVATRYQFTGTVSGAATQLGILLSYTPVGTAGATEYIDFYGFQLEIASAAGPFEHRDVQVELEICQRYAYVLTEGSSGVVAGAGQSFTATTGEVVIALPVQMRIAPSVATVIGGFKITNAAGTGQTVTTLAAVANGHTVNGIGLAVTTSGTVTAGNGALLVMGGSTGSITASADY